MLNRIKKMIINHKLPCEIVFSFVLAIGMVQLFGKTRSREFVLALIIYIAIFTLLRVCVKMYSLRRLKFSLWVMIPFSIAFWFGHKVANQSIEIASIGIVDILVLVAVILVFTMMSICALGFIDKKRFTPNSKMIEKSKFHWLKYSVIILCCWLPLYLCFFPGIMSSDSAVQVRQAIGESAWSNWHPVLHTALIALPTIVGFNMSGDLTMGIALFVIIQMMLLSVIYGYAVYWVIDKTRKKWIGYIFAGFFGLCPVVASYSMIVWKDIMFSSIFMLLFMKVVDLVMLYKRGQKIKLKDIWLVFLLAVLVAFLRNGGILIILTLGIALFVYYRVSRKIITIVTVISIMFTAMVQGPIYGIIGIKSSPFLESLSVPVQQIGYVASTGGLSEEEKSELSRFADVDKLANNYSPMNADPAKNSFSYEAVEEDKVGFLKLWMDILTKHFPKYVKAYILQTYSYWYIQGDVWVLDYRYSHDKIWLEQEYNDVPLLGESVKSLAEKIELGLMNTPWLGWVTSVGVVFWGMIYMVMVFIYQRRYKLLIPMACIVIYMVSLLIASPISWIFRYVYSLELILPFAIVISFIRIDEKEKR